MPEALLIYSLLIYPQAWALSLSVLILGIASRLFCYAQQREDRKLIAITDKLVISEHEIN